MNNQQHTIDGLPVVSAATYESTVEILARSLLRDGPKTMIDRLQEEQPNLYRGFERLLDAYDAKNQGPGFAAGFFIMYEINRRQSSSAKLSS